MGSYQLRSSKRSGLQKGGERVWNTLAATERGLKEGSGSGEKISTQPKTEKKGGRDGGCQSFRNAFCERNEGSR